MVGTRGSTLEFSGSAFDAAVQRAVDALLPGLTTRITNKIRQNGLEKWDKPPSNQTVGKGWEIEASFWDVLCEFKARLASYKLEGDALNWSEQQKYEREYHTIRQRDGETSGEFMKRFLRLAGFVGKKAGPPEEQAKHFKWALCDWTLDGIVNTEFTDVAQVANAARNIEILRERSSQNNKRNRDGDRIRPTAQGSNQRGYDQKGYDGRSYDRQDGNSNQKAWQNRGQQYNRSSGSSGQKGYPDYASSPPCDTCGKLHPGKACHRVIGACFTCGSTGHMAKDFPKNGGNGGKGNGNDNQPAAKGQSYCHVRHPQPIIFHNDDGMIASRSLGSRVLPPLQPRHFVHMSLSYWSAALPPLNLVPIISRHLPPDNLVPIISRRHVASCHWTAATGMSDRDRSDCHVASTCHHRASTCQNSKRSRDFPRSK
ncbi:zinc finger, CCHC-type, retrotransposon gag domain protein [Tanacetum coccineum]